MKSTLESPVLRPCMVAAARKTPVYASLRLHPLHITRLAPSPQGTSQPLAADELFGFWDTPINIIINFS